MVEDTQHSSTETEEVVVGVLPEWLAGTGMEVEHEAEAAELSNLVLHHQPRHKHLACERHFLGMGLVGAAVAAADRHLVEGVGEET